MCRTSEAQVATRPHPCAVRPFGGVVVAAARVAKRAEQARPDGLAAAGPKEMQEQVGKAKVAAQLRSDVAEAARHWVPSRRNDAGDLVYLAWAFPRTCRLVRTLPTLASPEKPRNAEWSNPAARKRDCPC